MRRASAAPAMSGPMPAGARARWDDDQTVRRIMPSAPPAAAPMAARVEETLRDIAHQIVAADFKRVLVTLAEDSDNDGRPLGAVALARSLARNDARVVLVDFRGDGADAQSMGEGDDLPGFSDLFEGEASFTQVIFRDRKSRVHFIPAGRKPLTPRVSEGDHLDTILAALTLTYDYVLIDAADDMIPVVGASCGVAMVVSEFGSDDPRTTRAFDRVNAVSDAPILLLVVDPAEAAAMPAGEAAA
jgi:Mrp family chromosome partitioning ATPase